VQQPTKGHRLHLAEDKAFTAYIFGAGAYGRVVLDTLRDKGGYDSIAFLDEKEDLWGRAINGAPIVGGLDAVRGRDPNSFGIVVAIGHPSIRLAIAARLGAESLPLFDAIHPTAVLAPSTTIGSGNMICPLAVVDSNATLCNHIILNIQSIVGHDTVIEDGVTVCPQVSLGGRVHVGRGAFIGTGALVVARVRIGCGAVVGAGALVLNDVPDHTFVVGTPARAFRKVDDNFDWRPFL
jgi:sugar O-acyltransferase (sialic acid O-acetyltransferase NeuD family)